MSRPSSLKLEQSASKDSILLKMSGILTEEAHFPEINGAKVKRLVVDFRDVSYINSLGLQRWVLWTRELKNSFPALTLHLEKIPSVVLRSVALIKEFMPAEGSVESVVLNLTCPSCESQCNHLVMKTNPTAAFAQFPSCESCGAKMRTDLNADQHLWFWKIT